MFADLHLHTRFSDGTNTPEELVAEARRHELVALALTDHDTVEGCAPTAIACAAAGIEFLSGVELTAEHEDQELHLLGYGMDITNAPLLAALAHFQEVRQERIREMVARLNRFGVTLDPEAVFTLADCRAPGRPHVARALVEAGLGAEVQDFHRGRHRAGASSRRRGGHGASGLEPSG
jgi:predicted metal-dependent phosphoesterase TrpH